MVDYNKMIDAQWTLSTGCPFHNTLVDDLFNIDELKLSPSCVKRDTMPDCQEPFLHIPIKELDTLTVYIEIYDQFFIIVEEIYDMEDEPNNVYYFYPTEDSLDSLREEIIRRVLNN